jgi:hypothetical protein
MYFQNPLVHSEGICICYAGFRLTADDTSCWYHVLLARWTLFVGWETKSFALVIDFHCTNDHRWRSSEYLNSFIQHLPGYAMAPEN